MEINNPFSITFGEEPKNFIPRENEVNQITSSFNSDTPDSKIYVLAGPRGSGKTVLLTHIKRIYDEKKNWITADLNPYGDMLEQLCAKLYEKGKVKHLFLQAEFNFSFKGLGFSIHGENPVSNVESLLEKMFAYLNKKQTRVLITIDDVINNENMRFFIRSYQSFVREQFPVFLLMSGLYENISDLENDRGLTFLIRAPKVYLEKLSLSAISRSYMKLLNVNQDDAVKLAKLTMGYAYGYQLLGNLLYKNNTKLDDEVMEQYDLTLEGNVYSLIWKNLSKKDKKILAVIAKGKTSIKDIMEEAGINNSALQVYKNRLFKAGLVDISRRGEISLCLPRLKEYIQFQSSIEE